MCSTKTHRPTGLQYFGRGDSLSASTHTSTAGLLNGCLTCWKPWRPLTRELSDSPCSLRAFMVASRHAIHLPLIKKFPSDFHISFGIGVSREKTRWSQRERSRCLSAVPSGALHEKLCHC